MRDFKTAYTNSDGVDFPDTTGVNASSPSATDGTEFVKISVDDGFGWGWIQALLSAAGLTPNGSAEAVGNSQLLEAWGILFETPDRYISGLGLTDHATAYRVTIETGECRDSTDVEDIVLVSALSKDVGTAWAVGTDQGGLDTGAVAANTGYWYWLIKRSDTGVVDALFSLSATAPTMPTDYDRKRLIGAAVTNGTPDDNLAFTSLIVGGDLRIDYDVMIQDEINVDPGTSRVTVPLTVSTGISMMAHIVAVLRDSTSGLLTHVLITNPDETDTAPSDTLRHFTGTPVGGDAYSGIVMDKNTDASGQIAYRLSSSTADHTMRVAINGFTVPRS